MTFCVRLLGMIGLSYRSTTGPRVVSDCLCLKYGWSCKSQSLLFSGTPCWTVLCSRQYCGDARQPATNLSQVRASTSSLCLIAAKWATMMPWRKSSKFSVSALSSFEGWTARTGAAVRGSETQAGGPNVSLYCGWTLLSVECLGSCCELAGLVLATGQGGRLATGESDLLESASGMTWSFPGIYTGLKRNASDLILKSSRRGFGISASSCLPIVASNGL